DDVDDAVAQAEKLSARAADSKRRAMELFVEQEDGSYVATIKTTMKLELSIGYVSAGMSFRQTAEAVGMTHRTCNIAKLAGLSDTIVGQWVRILVGGCLQQIANLLADDDLWAFALAFDGSIVERRSDAPLGTGASDEPGIKAIIDAHSNQTKFNDGWNSIGRARFSQLRRFCSGMASVFANTTSVESDFSILKWEKDEFRMNLLDLSLDGIFQAKQFKLLGLLDPNPVPQADDDDDNDA
ncbi:hypothetical protein DYB31_016824, partial [Aphanomyces astaci]